MEPKEHVTERGLSVRDNLESVNAYLEALRWFVVRHRHHTSTIEKQTFEYGKVGLLEDR
jgi:hypothetical protein